MNTEAIGEIISSSITSQVVEAWDLENPDGSPRKLKPAFGSFLRIDCSQSEIDVFAVVHNVITGPRDNVHRPSALRLSREQLRSEQPQIFALLKTEIHALTIGYIQGGRIYRHLPPHPPEVHDFVYLAGADNIRAVSAEFEFIRLLSEHAEIPTDELIAAAIRESYRAHNSDLTYLQSAGQTLSQLFRADYDRLISILKKIRPESPL